MLKLSTSPAARRWQEGWRPAVWLFDFDGTLADSLELIMASFRHATAEVLGEVPDDAVLRAGIGRPLIDQMQVIAPDRADELFDVFVAHNTAWHDRLLRPYPGIDALLAGLRGEGRRLGVVTSKRRDTVDLGLRLLGLDGFETIVGWEDTTAHKPGPEPVLCALDRMAAAPGDAIYVGDTAWDVRAGRAAGVATAAVLWGVGSREELEAEGPDVVLATAGEALE